MRPDAVHSYLVTPENIVGMKGLILLVCIQMSYPSQLLTITWVSSRRLSSFMNFLVDFLVRLRLIKLDALEVPSVADSSPEVD